MIYFTESRNPLFIKSEFSQRNFPLERQSKTLMGLSQSFIHQVRILSEISVCPRACAFHDVAILYSSSQNSLLRCPEDGHLFTAEVSQSFIHQVRILSGMNASMTNPSRPGSPVAILYSSSQNSLKRKR